MMLNIQKQFATPFEEISPQELKKCLQKFHMSARKSDGISNSHTSLSFLLIWN